MIDKPTTILEFNLKPKVVEDIKLSKPKFARMSIDQADIDISTLLVEPEKLERYSLFLNVYPGLKYIKKSMEFLPLNNIRI